LILQHFRGVVNDYESTTGQALQYPQGPGEYNRATFPAETHFFKGNALSLQKQR